MTAALLVLEPIFEADLGTGVFIPHSEATRHH
jgi:hypothetical protein